MLDFVLNLKKLLKGSKQEEAVSLLQCELLFLCQVQLLSVSPTSQTHQDSNIFVTE